MRHLFLFLLFFQFVAHAQPLQAPNLEKGQFVYTVPPNFDPPLIGRAGLQTLQKQAKALHYPFYVVIAQSFDGQSDDDASDAVDGIVRQWAQNPDFDQATSSVFLLTYSPRKYRLIAGSRWEAKLGLKGNNNLKPFLDTFQSYVSSSSKDPRTGILETMKQFDDLVWEQTDPTKIAARQKAQKQAQIAQRKAQANTALRSQISRAQNLLSQTAYLPPDTTQIRAALIRAQNAQNSDAAQKLAAAATLKPLADELQNIVEGKRRSEQNALAAQRQKAEAARIAREQAETQRRLAQQGQRMVLFLLGAIVLLFLVFRWRRLGQLREQFLAAATSWDERLLNAENNYLRFFEERRGLQSLADSSGQTRAMFEEVTRESAIIYPAIQAMKERVAQCKDEFARGSFVKLGPLKKANELLEQEFDFQTDKVPQDALFAPQVGKIRIRPQDFTRQVEEQYKDTIGDWNELKVALELQDTIAQDAFSSEKLTQILETADQNQIPHRYFASHPLFDDDASDQSLYEKLNQARQTDPLAYKREVAQLELGQSELEAILARLVAAQNQVAQVRSKAAPSTGETLLRPEDDPKVSFGAALRADENFGAALNAGENVEAIEAKAETAANLYAQCQSQIAAWESALKNTPQRLEEVRQHLQNAARTETAANARLEGAAHIHANVSTVQASVQNGARYADRARHVAQKAERQWSEKWHLDAFRSAQEAAQQCDLAVNEWNGAIALCDQLDEQKRQYELRLAQMEAARRNAEASLRRYGGRHRLDSWSDSRMAGPMDYALMIGQMQAQQQAWENSVRAARQAHEAEQARLERERDAERRREASRRSSSSSSSWGRSSGSSSGGGSWSGSSRSSSSNSSSGGGSW